MRVAVSCCAVVRSYHTRCPFLFWLGASSSTRLRSAERTTALAHQHSAVQFHAGPCRALPCPAVRYCSAVLCNAVPCCVLFAVLFIHACQVSFEVSHHQYYCCTYHVLCVESQKKCSHSSAQPSYSSAAPCGAVPFCAVLSFEDTAVPGIMRYPVPTGIYVRLYSSFFRFLELILGPPFFSKITPVLAIRT